MKVLGVSVGLVPLGFREVEMGWDLGGSSKLALQSFWGILKVGLFRDSGFFTRESAKLRPNKGFEVCGFSGLGALGCRVWRFGCGGLGLTP